MRDECHRKDVSMSIGWEVCRSAGNDKIWVFWSNEVIVNVVEVSEQVITLRVQSPELEKEMLVSCVYASCNGRVRKELWGQLETMAEGMGNHRWACFGDFNCILNIDEKKGGLPYNITKSRDFQECVDRADLREVTSYGGPFSWWNGRQGEQAVWKKLDRCMVNAEWDENLKTHNQYLSKASSDHSPMVLTVEPQIKFGKKPFRYLNVWSEHEQFIGVVRRGGEVEAEVQNEPSEQNLIRYKKVQAEYQRALAVEEKFWQQKSHVRWVVEGEKNTKYYHGLVKERRRKQVIHKIKREEGGWVVEQDQIANMAVEYYQKLFEAQETQLDLTMFECLQGSVTEEENRRLVANPTAEEIKESIFSMNPNSSAGPDGFGGGFYQSCWDVIKGDFCEVIVSFFQGKSLTKFITHTAIVLIPKIPNPATFADYRPISLSNFCNKVISKIMVMRLAEILARLVGPSQAGFVKGRNIIDNILLAQELCQGMTVANKDVVLKLDMAKAYDRMSWKCVLAVLKKFGFSQKWVDLVDKTINNIWYSVIVNGNQCGFFHSTRGLRQGDPLSPSLFIIAAELLSSMLRDNNANFSQAKGGPKVNHLSFADDMIVFTTGRGDDLRNVMHTLENYENQSGQLVNKAKSGFYLHKNVRREVVTKVKVITKFQQKDFPFTYLGCPVYMGRKNVSLFAALVDRVSTRCRGWHTKLLSQGGKAVLVKSVLQALPMHIFSAIDPPKAVIKQLERIFANFFWGEEGGKLRYHWSSWESMAKDVDMGGVGFTSLREMVEAAGTKLWWHFRTERSLWGDYMKAKYCGRSNPVCKSWQYKDSHVWRRMVRARERVEGEIQWKVGEGKVNLWWDNWSGEGALARILNVTGKTRSKEMLCGLYKEGGWDLEGIGTEGRRLFTGLSLREGVPDTAQWRPEANGKFTFAAAKKYEKRQSGSRMMFKHWSRRVWAKHVPWKISFLAWRVFKRKVPMDDVLVRFGYSLVSKCNCCIAPALCTLQHVFCAGEVATEVWGYFAATLGIKIQIRSLAQVCYSWWSKKKQNRLERFIVERLPMLIIWGLWVGFTQSKYGGKKINAARVKYHVAKEVADCIARRWPGWDPFPPSWAAILRRVERFGVQSLVRGSRWSKPQGGWIKVNLAEGTNGKSCGFVIRNANGVFCLAGAYSVEDMGVLNELREVMIQDIWAWCRRKKLEKVVFESDEPCFKAVIQGGSIMWKRCSSQVNCLAAFLANKFEKESLVFWKKGGLPHGFFQLLSLEGAKVGMDRLALLLLSFAVTGLDEGLDGHTGCDLC
ncbi:uncharacterized protein LOC115999629 [Ipomoea triloba]|uniref:uncharacterized protein LOC115999629 n=1 Tax=Ipomoea triloba TaxID=35885 RepID=UPI00125E4AE7|nr:uncharacterized protein LOC115999629 [Ipomoea triloba]